VNDKNPILEDRLLITAWKPIEMQLKRDLKKFEEIKVKRSEAGKKSAEIKAQQNSTNSTLVESVQHPSTNSTDNVNDNDTVNVNVNVNVNDNVNEISLDVPTKVETPPRKKKLLFSESTMHDFEPQEQNAFNIAKGYHDLFTKNLTEKNAPLTNLKKADARDWTRQIVLMLKNEEATIEQMREVWDFLKVDEFWKTNVQSVPKLREKFSTIYLQSKKPKNDGNSKGTGGASDAFKRRIFETLTGQSGN
jgi:hypothetical protein